MASAKAKLIASAVRGGTVFAYAASSKDPVLAATDAYKTLNKMETSSFECSDCGSQQHVVASVTPEPYCVTCGSERVIESNTKVPVTSAFVSDKELVSITCSACDTENVLPRSAVTAATGHVHCVTCGTGLEVAETEDAPKAEEDKEEATPAPVAVAADDGPGEEDDEDDFPEDASSDEDMEEETSEADDEDTYSEESAIGDGSEDLTMGMEDEDEEMMTETSFGDMGADPMMAEEELFLPESPVGMDSPGEPMMDAMGLDDTPVGLELVSKANVLLAMKGIHVVAYAREADLGKNADIMHQPEYAKAVAITAQRLGTRKALARMGFKNVYVKPTDVKAAATAVAKAKSKFAEEAAAKQQVFADCLAIAAAGLAKGFFKGFNDPLRASLEAQLSQGQGARTAKVTASRLMTTSGIEYSQVLVQLANKLSGMTAQTRKEYAEMLELVADDANVSVTANAEEMPNNDYGVEADMDEEEVSDSSEDLDSVQSRLSTAALFLRPKGVKASVKADKDPSSNARAILAGTAPLRFSS